ncbi:hypothetical protein DFP72DRAFT_904954 [Ephemerocybe angulata]|uniref:Uncharacterized protein n=1 Tax=Ephemerocybe angulata TaxID=980116 RepID=A0A8H6HTH0_9AGAR|nr:hypothetical protein DFP72DRAFT_904954 [Tulosesus angulatus]
MSVSTNATVVSYRLPTVPPEEYDAYVLEFVGGTLALIPYGISLTLFISCLNSLIPTLRRSSISVNSRALFLQLTYISLIFLAGTLYTAAGTWVIVYLKLEYPMYPGGTLAWELEHYNHPVINLGNAGFVLTSWFSDGFMMYRCYIVYNRGWRTWPVLILPGVLYVASIATGVLLLTQTSLPKQSLFSKVNFALAYFALVASLHILLTLLISSRLWMHRIRLQKALAGDGDAQLRSPHSVDTAAGKSAAGRLGLGMYTSASSILIESSALYSTFALLFIVPFALGHPAAQFTLCMLAQVQVISPLLVNYRLIQKKAWTSATTQSINASLGGMRFGEGSVVVLKEKEKHGTTMGHPERRGSSYSDVSA